MSIDPAQEVFRTARLCTPWARHIDIFSPQAVSVTHAWVTLVNLKKASTPPPSACEANGWWKAEQAYRCELIFFHKGRTGVSPANHGEGSA